MFIYNDSPPMCTVLNITLHSKTGHWAFYQPPIYLHVNKCYFLILATEESDGKHIDFVEALL
jgi:hypothetical protein